MAKTIPPGTFEPGYGTAIRLNAVPDAFDRRDFEYRPRLEPLVGALGEDDLKNCYVMTQEPNSCVGHALAAVINIVLARQKRNDSAHPVLVSPYMLYRLARRYDDFAGERDEGTSLRGALKGWFQHGVCLLEDFDRLNLESEPDLDAPQFSKKCRNHPLGAFYRVNPYRLDDMQSALNELHAVVVSAVIHDGWRRPRVLERDGERIHVIVRDVESQVRGGHAFAVVGYNSVGFVIQNSWGKEWGAGGFATLPYEDWLDSAYDAWVVRPGVAQTPLTGGRVRDAESTGGILATGRGPDLRRLDVHVVNIGANGLLSSNGSFVSTPSQIDRAFVRMKEWHDRWASTSDTSVRHILLYAPGGAVKEGADLDVAQRHVNWWLNNQIYPIYFWWRSGPAETLLSELDARVRDQMPEGGVGFDLVEQFDRLVELTARARFRWVWEDLKRNACLACREIAESDARGVSWPPRSTDAINRMASLPAASLVVHRLVQYVAAHGLRNVRIHLLGHGAGALFINALMARLFAARVNPAVVDDPGSARPPSPLRIESLTFLAPALRLDEFARSILPNVGDGKRIARFTTFAMSDVRETNDTCGSGSSPIYQKSFLYLISRGLEQAVMGSDGVFEVPLLGMAKYLDQPLEFGGRFTVRQEIAQSGGACIVAPCACSATERSDAESHSGFDDDVATMTSVVMRMRSAQSPRDVRSFVRNDSLESPVRGRSAPEGQQVSPASQRVPLTGGPSDASTQTVATRSPGDDGSVTEDAPTPTSRPPSPPKSSRSDVVPEVADNPQSGSAVLDMLLADGWTQINGALGTAGDVSD